MAADSDDKQYCPQCGSELPANVAPGHCPKCLLQLGFESEVQDSAQTDSPQSEDGTASDWTKHTLQLVFPELELIEEVGRGGMGVVWKARQPGLDRFVALKLLRPRLADDAAFAERFSREARAMAQLSHPSIIGVYDFGRRGNHCYFMMEYVDGVNLRDVVRAKTLSPEDALKIVPQICDALQYAHDQGIVHRDIKPENILLDSDCVAKVADFGLAKLINPEVPDWTLTGTHQVMGTVHYMAPEQTERPADVDHRADIFSLGVVIYEMLTGELPLGRFDPPSHKVRIDARLDEVVLKTLQKEPERRYQHVSQVASEVQHVTSTESPTAECEPAESRFDPPQLGVLRLLAVGLGIAGSIDLAIACLRLPDVFFFQFQLDVFVFGIVHLAGGVALLAAADMWRGQALSFVRSAAVISIVPLHFGAIIGVPVGVWTLMMLSRPIVRDSFAEAADRTALDHLRSNILRGVRRFNDAGHWLAQFVSALITGNRQRNETAVFVRSEVIRIAHVGIYVVRSAFVVVLLMAIVLVTATNYGSFQTQVKEHVQYKIGSSLWLQIESFGQRPNTGLLGNEIPRQSLLITFDQDRSRDRPVTLHVNLQRMMIGYSLSMMDDPTTGRPYHFQAGRVVTMSTYLLSLQYCGKCLLISELMRISSPVISLLNLW